MEKDSMSRISLYKNEYVEHFKNTEKTAVYMPSPTVLLTSFADKEFINSVSCGLTKTLSDTETVKAIDAVGKKPVAVVAELKDALENFKSIAGRFSNAQSVNIFAVGNAEAFKNGDFNEMFNVRQNLWFGTVNTYAVCIIDELDKTGAEHAVAAMKMLESLISESRIFVLGRQKINGKIVGSSNAKKAHCRIIRDLVLNADKISLPVGAYSAGYASFDDCIGGFWTEALGKCSPIGYGTDLQAEKSEVIIEKINRRITDGYENNFSVSNLRRVLKNDVTVSFSDEDLEDCVRRLYGNSLDVYLEYERRKIDGVASDISKDIKQIIMSADIKTKTKLQKLLESSIETIAASDNSGFQSVNMLGGEVSNMEKQVFEKYLLGKISELKRYYMSRVLNLALDVISNDIRAYREAEKTLEESKKSVKAYVTNHMKTSAVIGVNLSNSDIKLLHGDYIAKFCEGLNVKLLDGECFEKNVETEPEAVALWLRSESDPYCISNTFSVNKSYYITGMSDIAKKINAHDNSFTLLGASYDDFDAVLNCTSVNISEYRAFITP